LKVFQAISLVARFAIARFGASGLLQRLHRHKLWQCHGIAQESASFEEEYEKSLDDPNLQFDVGIVLKRSNNF